MAIGGATLFAEVAHVRRPPPKIALFTRVQAAVVSPRAPQMAIVRLALGALAVPVPTKIIKGMPARKTASAPRTLVSTEFVAIRVAPLPVRAACMRKPIFPTAPAVSLLRAVTQPANARTKVRVPVAKTDFATAWALATATPITPFVV